MRGFSQFDTSSLKEALGYAAIGAVGGAAAGAFTGGSGWMTAASVGTTAATATAGTAASLMIKGGDELGGLPLLAAPIAGSAVGLAGGLLGYGISAVTGMSPVASGAIAGAISGATIALVSQ